MAPVLRKTSWFFCLFLAMCFLQNHVDCSRIAFSSSSSYVKPFISNNLTLSCVLLDTAPVQPAIGKRSVPRNYQLFTAKEGAMVRDQNINEDETMQKKSVNQTAENIQFVTSMVISRDGVDLATISEHFPVKALIPEVSVTGHLTNGQEERGKLQLTWSHPSDAEAGNYQCVVDTLSPEGHSIIFSQTLNIAEEEVSLSDISAKMHKLELEKEQMQNTINNLLSTDASINLKIDNINKADTAMKTDITNVNQTLTALQNIARVEPNIFFTAYLSGGVKTYTQNQVIVFNTIVTNEGNAYNNGIFTCPLDGFYYFEVHLLSDGGHVIYAEIQQNGRRLISANKYGNPSYGAVSNSVIVKLRKNDKIRVVNWHSGTSYLYANNPNGIDNTFSGRLVSLV